MADQSTGTTFIHPNDLPWARAVNMETVECFYKQDYPGDSQISFNLKGKTGPIIWGFGQGDDAKTHRDKVYAQVLAMFSQELTK